MASAMENLAGVVGLAIVLTPAGLIALSVYVAERRERGRYEAMDRLISDKHWKRLPLRTNPRDELAGSVLSAFTAVTEASRVLGEVEGRKFLLSDLSLGRPTHFFPQHLTMAEFELPRVAPHILIVPRGSRFIGGASLENDYHLRAMELEGRPAKLYVPEGFEIEALEILEADVWEALERERVVVEINGPSVRFFWPKYLQVEQTTASVEWAAGTMKKLYGVAESELTGPYNPELTVNRTVSWVSNITPEQANRVAWGILMVAALGLLVLGVLQMFGVQLT